MQWMVGIGVALVQLLLQHSLASAFREVADGFGLSVKVPS
jgi:hypothetical protein